MKDKQVCAVVDLETTETDPTSDRIVQFGCVLVQDGKIVANFTTDVDPNQVVPKQIQNLAGTSNTQAQKAPYFGDAAHTIYYYLEDAVFMVHNVYFDYNFLVRELVRCDTPLLTIPVIDTVELAQIFLPTEKSSHLSDLSESSGLSHENPHRADGDAQVTAELLLLIQEKMKSLPLITIGKIAESGQQTARETSAFIQQTYGQMKKQVAPLDLAYQVVSDIALRKKEVPLFEETFYQTNTHPKTKKAKEKPFDERFAYRAEQSRMMNLVYDHFAEGTTKDLFIEAATGTGETLGYLLPMSYLATPERLVITSIVSIVLQNQLVERNLPLANQICQGKLQDIVIKSHRHYLDL